MLTRKIRLAIALCTISLAGQGQQILKDFELMEIVTIAEIYSAAPHLSFNVSYTYADSANPSVVIEQMTGQTKLNSGNYYALLGDMIQVRSPQLNLSVYTADSVIAVSETVGTTTALHLPLLDSLFRAANVLSVRVDSLNDSTRVFTADFVPGALIKRYKAVYNPITYRLSKVEYYSAEYAADVSEGLSGTSLITMLFSAYSDTPINQDLYKESSYIFRVNGTIVPAPAYTGFTVTSSTPTNTPD